MPKLILIPLYALYLGILLLLISTIVGPHYHTLDFFDYGFFFCMGSATIGLGLVIIFGITPMIWRS